MADDNAEHAYDHTHEEVLQAAATDLRRLFDEIAHRYVDAATIVSLLPGAGIDKVAAFLGTHAGLAPREVDLLASLGDAIRGPLLERRELLTETPLFIGALEALILAPEAVQRKVLELVDRGELVRSDQISVLVEQHRRQKTPAWIQEEDERRARLEEIAEPAFLQKLATLESFAAPVCDGMMRFQESWLHGEFDDDEPFHDYCRKDLAAAALRTIAPFEDVFGLSGQLPEEEPDDVIAARSALRQIADGRFGDGFGIQVHMPGRVGIDLAQALSPLAPVDAIWRAEPPRKPLRVLELCGGAGGMSLGLQAAGFTHDAIYEKHKPSVASLKANQPHWPVRQSDIFALPDEELAAFRHVDLLAAGLPCGPEQESERKPDLHAKTIEIISAVKPKTFLLECDAGIRKTRDAAAARTKTTALLGELGYDVTDFVLDTAEFGLPHSTDRAFFVGVDKSLSRLFERPFFEAMTVGQISASLASAEVKRKDETDEEYRQKGIDKQDETWKRKERPGWRRGVGSVLENAIAVHFKGGRHENASQKRYDSWARHWRSHYADAMLPNIPEKPLTVESEAWSKSGFRHLEIVEFPPTLEEVDGADFLPRLTYEALAAAQGFPSSWQFLADGNGKLPMIQAALPPVMSKMVALALRSVLTGESFDLDHEVRIEIRGRPSVRLLREPRGQFQRLAVNDVYLKASRVLDGEELKKVEPNHKKRTEVKAMIALVREERSRLEKLRQEQEDYSVAQDEAWEADHFPDGVSA